MYESEPQLLNDESRRTRRRQLEFQNSKPAWTLLLEDYHLFEKIANFDRERIPERVVHARGAGAFGTFKVEQAMNRYTKATSGYLQHLIR